jgi:hypothetical protein
MKLIWAAFIFWSLSSYAYDNTLNRRAQGRSNPDMGINILLLGQNASDTTLNGFRFQEAELQLSSNIDPYWWGTLLLTVEPEIDNQGNITGYSTLPEEVYFENISIPGVAFRVGRQRLYFGKTNFLHLHALPFIDFPLTVTEFWGEEGLTEDSVSASYLFKTKNYLELIAQIGNGENERLYNANQGNDPLTALYLKALWDLSPSSTFEALISYARGTHPDYGTTDTKSVSLTYKKPQTNVTLEGAVSDVLGNIEVASLWFNYRIGARYITGGRIEYADTYTDDFAQNFTRRKLSLLAGYIPTEFSAVRLQYDQIRDSLNNNPEHVLGLQFNFAMGLHPAHVY